ncbi:hypothetical protein [Helicobacter sp. T3_23-1059]
MLETEISLFCKDWDTSGYATQYDNKLSLRAKISIVKFLRGNPFKQCYKVANARNKR